MNTARRRPALFPFRYCIDACYPAIGKQATEINPSNYSAWHNMSIAYVQIGSEEEAFECYRKAIEINESTRRYMGNTP